MEIRKRLLSPLVWTNFAVVTVVAVVDRKSVV